jgi:hypothetical protein
MELAVLTLSGASSATVNQASLALFARLILTNALAHPVCMKAYVPSLGQILQYRQECTDARAQMAGVGMTARLIAMNVQVTHVEVLAGVSSHHNQSWHLQVLRSLKRSIAQPQWNTWILT